MSLTKFDIKDLTKDQQIKALYLLHQFVKICNETDGSEMQNLCTKKALEAEVFLRGIVQ